MNKKRKIWPKVLKLSAVVFLLYVAILLINNQIDYNQAKAAGQELEQRNHQQVLVNAGLEEQNRMLSDSEVFKQYALKEAYKMNLVKYTDWIFYDISK